MRYLIDGHNLIAHLPDIDLADPDDEAQLVYKLRGFCARTGNKVTVVFDGGIPGGVSGTLSNHAVTAKFASAEQLTADQVLLNHVRQAKNPRAYTLVSSDQEISAVAQACGMPTQRAAEFAVRLRPQMGASQEEDPNLRLSASEVDAWLAIFSPGEDH